MVIEILENAYNPTISQYKDAHTNFHRNENDNNNDGK